MSEVLLIERRPPAAIFTLNRPERHNALNTALLNAITSAARAVEQEPDIRGIILTGNDKAFSTGADLEGALDQSDPLPTMRWLEHFTDTNRTLEILSIPVVAAINGYCLTGGLEVALACDIRIAGSGAKFAITSSKIGSVAGGGGTQRLPRVVGLEHAKDMLMSADFYDAEAASRMGLVSRVVAPDKVMETALERVSAYASRAPLSVWYAKKAVNIGTRMPLDAALEYEQHLTTHLFATEDRTEGMSAFLEKRDAVFKGK